MATVKKIKIVDSQGVDVSYDIGALAQNIVYDNNNSVKDKIDDYEDIIPSSASSSNQLLTEEDLPVATDEQVGLVKPDGTTITIDENGTLTAIGGGGTAGHFDGTTAPTSAIGQNGDEYFKLSGSMPNIHITSFKFKVTATRSTGSGMNQYSQLSFFDASDNAYIYPSGTTWTDDVGHIENDPITAGDKILLNETPSTVTVNLPSGSYIDSTVYSKFGWYTANDSEDRDPVSWELYVSEDKINYILIDTRTQETITTNRQVLAFKDSYVSSTMPVINDIYYKKSGEWLKTETALSALSDTVITTPTDGQVLGFNSITGKWGNMTASGGSYTAGNGININNNVISNTRKGALTGVIDSVSSNIAHTQIDNALTTITAGTLVVLKAEASGTSVNTVRVQYGSQASDSNDFRLRDTSGNYTTIDVALDDTIIMMLNATGYQMIVLSILGATTSGGYPGLGIGKKRTVTNNVIDTDIDLHHAPIVGDRLLIYFDATVQNPTGLTTYNNGTAVTSNLENVTPLYINGGQNILEFKNDGFLYNNCWVRIQNVPIPNNTLSGLTDTFIALPSDGQILTYDNSTSKWKNKDLQPNASGTPVRELKTLQIGNNVFNAFGLKIFDVTSVNSGASGAISVSVITASQLNGEIIAVHTGSNTGTTTNAWTLVLNDGQTMETLTMSKGGSAYTDAITADCLFFVKCNISNGTATLLSMV